MTDRFIRRFGFGMLIIMMLIVSACGGSGGGLGDLGNLGATTNNNMSEDQALAFAKSVTRVSTSSMSAPPLKTPVVSDETSQFKATTCGSLGCQVNEQIAYTLNCTSGGYMKASGNITGSISKTGTGTLLMDIPITILDWKCEPPSIINGDPFISITGTFSYLNGAPSTQQHVQVSGGFKSSDWSCQINLGTNFNTSGGGHTSGTICGYSVDFTF